MINLYDPKTDLYEVQKVFEKFTNALNASDSNKGLVLKDGTPLLWKQILKKKDEELLRTYGGFRKEFVDTLLRYVSQRKCKTGNCKAVSVGSVTPISDYDITVTGKSSADVVDEFNREFVDMFGNHSGDVFDTNLYGASFYEHCDDNRKYYEQFSNQGQFFCYISLPSTDKVAIDQQRIWALTKLDLHVNPKERKVLLEKLNDEIKNKYLLAIDLRKNLEKEAHVHFDRRNLSITNPAYSKSLIEVQSRKFELEKNNFSDDSKRRYKDSISKANFFGSETYFTQGAFLHVVGVLQSGANNISITKDEYFDSFIENMGDVFKEINHLEHEKDNIGSGGFSSKQCSKLIKKVSKYFTRAMDALINCIEIDNKDLKESLEESRQISEEIRKSVRGKTVSDICNLQDRECVTDIFAKELEDKFLKNMKANCNELRRAFFDLLIKYINKFTGIN